MNMTDTKEEIDEQRVRLVAALANCSCSAARRHLEGDRVKGIFLRKRLVAAVKKAEEICHQGDGGESTPVAR